MNDSNFMFFDSYYDDRTTFYIGYNKSTKCWLQDTPDVEKVLSSYHLMRTAYDPTYNTLKVDLTRCNQDVQEKITFLNVLNDIGVLRDAGLPEELISSMTGHLNKLLAASTHSGTNEFMSYSGTTATRVPVYSSSYYSTLRREENVRETVRHVHEQSRQNEVPRRYS